MAKAERQVAKIETPTAAQVALISDTMPSYLQEMQGKPAAREDNFDANDVVVPRVKLLQGLSKECETFETAKAGLFWHTGLDRALGPDFSFVIASRRKRYLLVAPIDDGQGILARADDFNTWDRLGKWEVKVKNERSKVPWEIKDRDVVKSGLAGWGTSNPNDENSPPAATLFYDYLILMPEHLDLGPAVMSIARSSVRKVKKGLNDKIELHRQGGRPMQSIVFKASSVNDKNDAGQEFKNWQFTGNGFANEALFKQAVELREALHDYKIADEEEAANEESLAGNRGSAPADKEGGGEF